jgi:hypothetical protein
MDPATMTAIVTAVIGAVGTVLGAWVGGRAQRQLRRERSRPSPAGDRATGNRIDQGTRVQVTEAGAVTGRELLPDDHR